jgi:4-hydroxy 2-oxovalerate aldolase
LILEILLIEKKQFLASKDLTMKPKILDCTLRDGGYYTNWDFDETIVEQYIQHTNNIPIDYIEIGYRNKKNLNGYNGEFYYTPLNTLKLFKEKSKHKISIMIDYKKTKTSEVESLLKECQGLVSLVRVAIQPENLKICQDLITKIKEFGFEVALNVMYLSKWDIQKVKNDIKKIEDLDYLYLVDSYGAVFPDELEKIIKEIKKVAKCSIGFHSHDNLELAFSNTLTSIKNEIDIVDSTILGMGRGAGNLKTELLLIKLSSVDKNRFKHYDSLSSLIDIFTPLKLQYNWGSDISYKFAGINSFPQKDIMSLKLSKNYKFSQILRHFDNQEKEKIKLTSLKADFNKKNLETLIIGGGPSILKHKKAIEHLLKINKNKFNIIFSSFKYSKLFSEQKNNIYQIVMGSDIHGSKMIDSKHFKYIFPSTEGLDIKKVRNNFYSLKFDNTNPEEINHLGGSILLASKILKSKKVFLIGFDGFTQSDNYYNVFKENQNIIDIYQKKLSIVSLTKTKYSINTESIYSYL